MYFRCHGRQCGWSRAEGGRNKEEKKGGKKDLCSIDPAASAGMGRGRKTRIAKTRKLHRIRHPQDQDHHHTSKPPFLLLLLLLPGTGCQLSRHSLHICSHRTLCVGRGSGHCVYLFSAASPLKRKVKKTNYKFKKILLPSDFTTHGFAIKMTIQPHD